MSFIVSEAYGADEGSSLSLGGLRPKKEDVKEEDFRFDEPCLKKQKTSRTRSGDAHALPSSEAQAVTNELNMNWDLIEVLLGLLSCFEV